MKLSIQVAQLLKKKKVFAENSRLPVSCCIQILL